MQNCKNYAIWANFRYKTLWHTSIFNNFAKVKSVSTQCSELMLLMHITINYKNNKKHHESGNDN